MHFESIYPFLLLLAPFAVACFAEAVVMYFFRLKQFWTAVGIAVVINLLSLVVLYGASLLVGKLGYAINGLQIPLQVLLFFWWLSALVDGVLLQVFSPKAVPKTIYRCSVAMNSLSWFFLYFFISNS